jgi:hypothetical protein
MWWDETASEYYFWDLVMEYLMKHLTRLETHSATLQAHPSARKSEVRRGCAESWESCFKCISSPQTEHFGATSKMISIQTDPCCKLRSSLHPSEFRYNTQRALVSSVQKYLLEISGQKRAVWKLISVNCHIFSATVRLFQQELPLVFLSCSFHTYRYNFYMS